MSSSAASGSGQPFVDTNVFLRHLLQDIPSQSGRATAFLRRLQIGPDTATTSANIMAEVVFTLERTYKTRKDTIRDLVVELMRIRGLALDDSSLVREALDIYVGRNVSYTDAVTAVEMKRNGILQVISFDHDFDRIPGITRTEP